jgi:hypothetical protein
MRVGSLVIIQDTEVSIGGGRRSVRGVGIDTTVHTAAHVGLPSGLTPSNLLAGGSPNASWGPNGTSIEDINSMRGNIQGALARGITNTNSGGGTELALGHMLVSDEGVNGTTTYAGRVLNYRNQESMRIEFNPSYTVLGSGAGLEPDALGSPVTISLVGTSGTYRLLFVANGTTIDAQDPLTWTSANLPASWDNVWTREDISLLRSPNNIAGLGTMTNTEFAAQIGGTPRRNGDVYAVVTVDNATMKAVAVTFIIANPDGVWASDAGWRNFAGRRWW